MPVTAGLHRRSVSVCSVCSSEHFMWLPGTENLAVSCQSFHLCSVPLSALKNLLVHTHELHRLLPWLDWAVSGHRAHVSLCRLCECECAMWQMGSNMAHLCPHRCGTAHNGEPKESSEHLDPWQLSPSTTMLTPLRRRSSGRRGAHGGKPVHYLSPDPEIPRVAS